MSSWCPQNLAATCYVPQLLALVMVLLCLGSAQAQELKEPPKQTVVLSPIFEQVEIKGLNEPGADAQKVSVQGGQAMEQGVRAHAQTMTDQFNYIGPQGLAQAILRQPGYMGEVRVGRGFAKLGLEHYKRLEITSAMGYLQQALSAFESVQHDAIAPVEVADVMFYLALSYLESGDNAIGALRLFQKIMVIDPSRQVKPGYYPATVLNAWNQAQEALVDDITRRGFPLWLESRAVSLSKVSGADWVLFGFVLPVEGQRNWRVHLFAWGREQKRVEHSLQSAPFRLIRDKTYDTQMVAEVGNRLVSEFYACTKKPLIIKADELPPSNVVGVITRSKWSADLHMSYGTYMAFPELKSLPWSSDRQNSIRHFGNWGLNLGVQWFPTEVLGFAGRVGMLLSQGDYSNQIGDDGVEMFRVMLGGEFGVRFTDLRLGLQFGLDGATLDQFEINTDLGCTPRKNSSICASSNVIYDDYTLLLGINFAPLVSYRIYRRLFINGMISSSYFFFSTSESDAVNFPIQTDLGLRYLF